MAYVNPDYQTKKAFKAALASGKRHYTYSHSDLFAPPLNGTDVVEGPHYPKPHRWYAQVMMADGVVVQADQTKLGQDAKPGSLPWLKDQSEVT